MKNPSLISAATGVGGGPGLAASQPNSPCIPCRAGAHHVDGDLGDGRVDSATPPVMVEQFGPVAWWNNRCEMQNGSRDERRGQAIGGGGPDQPKRAAVLP